jgi:sacsin
VYHWTDLPSFVSAKKLVMLDPQARFLPDVNPTNPGVMVNWVDKPDVLTRFPDQFAPYHFSGSPIDWTRPFNGTLFRLPLRTAAQAETSTLSKRALGTEDASVILDSLQAEASAMLLFLQNVESIEITYWEAGAPKPTRRFHCELANVSSSLRETRAFVKNKSKHEQAIKQKKEFPADYSLRINCSVGPPGGVTYVEEWEVCNQLGGLGASLSAGLPIKSLLRLVPWGGLAACVSTENPNNARQTGLAYCFLPLPVQTGLPVMVCECV